MARYVFPDGELPALGRLARDFPARRPRGAKTRRTSTSTTHTDAQGLVRDLDAHRYEAGAGVGQATARVSALHLAGSRFAFEDNRIQLHRLLVTKTAGGASGMPLRPSLGHVTGPRG